MAKGAKRARVKAALSPVRDIISPSSSKLPPTNSKSNTLAPTIEPNPDEDGEDDLMDQLMAELDSRDKTVQGEAATVIREIEMNRDVNESPSNTGSLPPAKKSSKGRHKDRQERKAARIAQQYAPVDEAADTRLQEEAKEEEKIISSVCSELGLEMHEISPDGHCLFAAIADQLSLLSLIPKSQATYETIRHTASNYMLSHPDDFIPFLPSTAGEDGAGAEDDGLMTPEQFSKYCAAIRSTGQWGGEPEIQALSRAFGVPIHVVQGGVPKVVVHEPGSGEVKSHKPAIISYHRRMYGLGEHYNSLRPKSNKLSQLTSGVAAVLT